MTVPGKTWLVTKIAIARLHDTTTQPSSCSILEAITRTVFQIRHVLFSRVRYIGIEKIQSKHLGTEMGGASIYAHVTHKQTHAVCKESTDTCKSYMQMDYQ